MQSTASWVSESDSTICFIVARVRATDGAKRRVPKQLSPLGFADFLADLTGNRRRGQSMFDGFRSIPHRAFQLAENDSAARRMLDHARPDELRPQVDDAGQSMLLTPTRRDLVRIIDAVLERQDRRGVADHRRQGADGHVGIVGLDAEKDKIDVGDFPGLS